MQRSLLWRARRYALTMLGAAALLWYRYPPIWYPAAIPGWGWLGLAFLGGVLLYILARLIPQLPVWRSQPTVPFLPDWVQVRIHTSAAQQGLGPLTMVVSPQVANACCVAAGWALSQRRWIIGWSPTYYRDYPPEEQLAVGLHELGHALNRDAFTKLPPVLGLIVYVAVCLTVLFSSHAPAGLPLLATLTLLLVAPPVLNHRILRPYEYAADAWAATLMGSPTALANVLRRSAARDTGPSHLVHRLGLWCYESHPTPHERLRHLEQFWQAHQPLPHRQTEQ